MEPNDLKEGDREVIHGIDPSAILEDHQETSMNKTGYNLPVERF